MFAGLLVFGRHDMPHRLWFKEAHLHAVAVGAFVQEIYLPNFEEMVMVKIFGVHIERPLHVAGVGNVAVLVEVAKLYAL